LSKLHQALRGRAINHRFLLGLHPGKIDALQRLIWQIDLKVLRRIQDTTDQPPSHPGLLLDDHMGISRLAVRQRLKRGVFISIVELQTAINRSIADDEREPFLCRGPARETSKLLSNGRITTKLAEQAGWFSHRCAGFVAPSGSLDKVALAESLSIDGQARVQRAPDPGRRGAKRRTCHD
jgi:hypothetical protein